MNNIFDEPLFELPSGAIRGDITQLFINNWKYRKYLEIPDTTLLSFSDLLAIITIFNGEEELLNWLQRRKFDKITVSQFSEWLIANRKPIAFELILEMARHQLSLKHLFKDDCQIFIGDTWNLRTKTPNLYDLSKGPGGQGKYTDEYQKEIDFVLAYLHKIN